MLSLLSHTGESMRESIRLAEAHSFKYQHLQTSFSSSSSLASTSDRGDFAPFAWFPFLTHAPGPSVCRPHAPTSLHPRYYRCGWSKPVEECSHLLIGPPTSGLAVPPIHSPKLTSDASYLVDAHLADAHLGMAPCCP